MTNQERLQANNEAIETIQQTLASKMVTPAADYATIEDVENAVKDKATITYVDTKVADLVNSAPETLDTLGEVATALQNNSNVVDALNSSIGNKVDKVDGKGLSTNDYTNAEKEKLSGLSNYDDTAIKSQINNKASIADMTAYINEHKDELKGDKGDSYVMTEADKAEIVQMIIESLGGNPVFGYVDKDNNIIVSGNLADGDYTLKYEMEDGSFITVGELVLDNVVEYTITKNLTNCSISNDITEVVAGESYSATISANSGYELKTITVTMGGSSIAVTNGVINIESVTGNIVITAVAEEVVVPTYTNQIPISKDANGNYFVGDNGEKGYKTNTRLSISAGGETTSDAAGCEVTGYIPAVPGDVLRIKNITTGSDGKNVLLYYDNNKRKKDSDYTATLFSIDEGNGVYASNPLRNVAGMTYIRFASENINPNSIVTRNEKIV